MTKSYSHNTTILTPAGKTATWLHVACYRETVVLNSLSTNFRDAARSEIPIILFRDVNIIISFANQKTKYPKITCDRSSFICLKRLSFTKVTVIKNDVYSYLVQSPFIDCSAFCKLPVQRCVTTETPWVLPTAPIASRGRHWTGPKKWTELAELSIRLWAQPMREKRPRWHHQVRPDTRHK